MCGIAGEIVFNGNPLHPLASWSRLIDRMWRRGPDSSGVWTNHRTALLGCRRLAVMDTAERANLPIRSEDGRYILAYNGEIYEWESLENELRHRGWQFRTRSDAEVVLAAIAEFGVEAFEKFNGIFALAFFDAREQRLILARDHAGVKPLYVLNHRRGAIFASEFELLLATDPGRGSPLDADAMAMYLRLGHIPAPRTMLRDIAMVEPGTWHSYSIDGGNQKGAPLRVPAKFRSEDKAARRRSGDRGRAGGRRSPSTRLRRAGRLLFVRRDRLSLACRDERARTWPADRHVLDLELMMSSLTKVSKQTDMRRRSARSPRRSQ